jgi:hypothetical protein
MSDSDGIKGRLEEVTRRLEQMSSELEALSAEIWRDIDHEDPRKLEAGVRFKQHYNERRRALDTSAEDMLKLLRAYPNAGPGPGVESLQSEGGATVEVTQGEAPQGRESVVRPEAARGSEALGNLDVKVPFGFVLSGSTFTSASAWPLFYEALLQELYGRDPGKLSALADEPGGFVYQGRPLFARVPDRLEDPLPVTDAIFAEADLAPGVLIEVIRGLISEMGYPLDSFKILLKEKNRGTVETLSIAA